MIGNLKTVADFEKEVKDSPYMYLVSFVTVKNEAGSMIMAMKEPQPLWRVYAIANEANLNQPIYTITNVVDLSDV